MTTFCDNCGDLINMDDDPDCYNHLTGQYFCEECREISADIDKQIADGIRKAGYRVY